MPHLHLDQQAARGGPAKWRRILLCLAVISLSSNTAEAQRNSNSAVAQNRLLPYKQHYDSLNFFDQLKLGEFAEALIVKQQLDALSGGCSSGVLWIDGPGFAGLKLDYLPRKNGIVPKACKVTIEPLEKELGGTTLTSDSADFKPDGKSAHYTALIPNLKCKGRLIFELLYGKTKEVNDNSTPDGDLSISSSNGSVTPFVVQCRHGEANQLSPTSKK